MTESDGAIHVRFVIAYTLSADCFDFAWGKTFVVVPPWQETSSATSDFKKIMGCLKSIQSPNSWCQTQLQLIKRNTGVMVMTGSAPTFAPTQSLAGS